MHGTQRDSFCEIATLFASHDGIVDARLKVSEGDYGPPINTYLYNASTFKKNLMQNGKKHSMRGRKRKQMSQKSQDLEKIA